MKRFIIYHKQNPTHKILFNTIALRAPETHLAPRVSPGLVLICTRVWLSLFMILLNLWKRLFYLAGNKAYLTARACSLSAAGGAGRSPLPGSGHRVHRVREAHREILRGGALSTACPRCWTRETSQRQKAIDCHRDSRNIFSFFQILWNESTLWSWKRKLKNVAWKRTFLFLVGSSSSDKLKQ